MAADVWVSFVALLLTEGGGQLRVDTRSSTMVRSEASIVVFVDRVWGVLIETVVIWYRFWADQLR